MRHHMYNERLQARFHAVADLHLDMMGYVLSILLHISSSKVFNWSRPGLKKSAAEAASLGVVAVVAATDRRAMLAQGSGQKSQRRRAPRRTFTRSPLRRQQPQHPPQRRPLQNPNETRGLADPTRVLGSLELKHNLSCNAAKFCIAPRGVFHVSKPLRFQVPGICGLALCGCGP